MEPRSGRLHVNARDRAASGDGLPDLVRRILLDEVDARHRDLGLVRPAAAEVARGADAGSAPGSAFTKSFGSGLVAEPRAVVVDDRDHVGGLALDRDLARPGERRPAALARLEEGPAVDGHLRVGQPAQDRARQHPLDEDVLLEHHRLAGGRAEALEDAARRLRPVRPGERADDRLHVGDAAHGVAVAVGPVEAERRAPVVDDQRHALAHAERVEQRIEVLGGARRSDSDRGRSARASSESPMPIRSGAMQRPSRSRCGMTLRQRYDDVGLPCRKTIGSPLPTSTYAIDRPRTCTRRLGYRSSGEIAMSPP